MSTKRMWTVEVVFTEEGDTTRADALLECGYTQFHGWGRAQRNPEDRDVPRIGAEIAAARALEDLVGKLLQTAEREVAEETGDYGHIHR